MMNEKLRHVIDQSYSWLYKHHDPDTANYVLRDLPETEEAGLKDLSWAMHKEGCHKNDVLYLIEKLQQYHLSNQKDNEE